MKDKKNLDLDKEIRKAHKRIHLKKRPMDIMADKISEWCASWSFLMIHVIWFIVWLALRLDINTLTMIVSLEAIILMAVLLMSQTRQARKDDLRDEEDFQSDLRSEKAIHEVNIKLDELIKKIDKFSKK